MHRIRCSARYVSFFMTLTMIFMTMPLQTVCAAMVGTETVLTTTQTQNARENLIRFLEREDVEAAMTAQGINPLEAKARVGSLSDTEVMRIADKIADKMDQLPAGGDGLGLLVVAALIVFLVLLFTDIAGYTDVFPFVKHQN
ncbi:MAG: PA2779 family protein [Desulfobacteraceae bacterium]|nr:PA2779 family protein [Desulfobacteraceae bacterium]